MDKNSYIFGTALLILGVLIIPPVAEIIFGEYVCGHYNMYLVDLPSMKKLNMIGCRFFKAFKGAR